MNTALKFTSADLATLPDDGKRYEIIEGELIVSKQPSTEHQYACGRLAQFLGNWNDLTNRGIVLIAPGVIFDDDDDVAPDVAWLSQDRLMTALGEDRKLHEAPELMIEVLSPGSANERRDRQTKLKLYSRRGVDEYWIVDCQRRRIEIHRREEGVLKLQQTLHHRDRLESPLLPGFSCQVEKLFFDFPKKTDSLQGESF